MTARIIDGKLVSRKVKEEVKARVAALAAEGRRQPCLAVILAGDDPASAIYVRNKQKACAFSGIQSMMKRLPADVSETELQEVIKELNEDPAVDGILLQLPLPEALRSLEPTFLEQISPDKDVDGFHPINIGRLALGLPAPVACTPFGVMRLLEECGESLEGKLAVVIGRSHTVGKPMLQLLLQKNATVIVTHSRTKDLATLTRQADVIIAALGKAHFVTADMVKDGAIVIDVGINRDEDGKVTGDVDFGPVSEKAAYITTVPGGVGPMTIAMLLENTLLCYAMHEGNIE